MALTARAHCIFPECELLPHKHIHRLDGSVDHLTYRTDDLAEKPVARDDEIVRDERTQATRYAWFPFWCLEDILIIEPAIMQQKKGSVIVLAGGAEKIPGGRVLAAGPGRYYHAAMNAAQTKESAIFVPNEVHVGDWVTYGKYQSGGEPFVWEGKKLIMARSGDLCARSVDGNPIDLDRWVQKENG